MSISRNLAELFKNLVQDPSTGGVSDIPSAEAVKELSERAYLEEEDTWLLTTSFSGITADITANLARSTIDGYEKIGSGMSQSSGVFTFPSTGKWIITAKSDLTLAPDSSDRAAGVDIHRTLNNLDYSGVAIGRASIIKDASSAAGMGYTEYKFNVTDITNQKIKFVHVAQNSNTTAQGSTTIYRTFFTFQKYAQ
jgi:hypothetical protein